MPRPSLHTGGRVALVALTASVVALAMTNAPASGAPGTRDARQSVPDSLSAKAVEAPSTVLSLGPNDGWLAGSEDLSHHRTQALAEHFDGGQWTRIDMPSPGAQENSISGLDGTGPDDVWAVGSYWQGTGGPDKALAEHWDGSTWSVVPMRQPYKVHRHFWLNMEGVSAIAPDDVWAVGYGLELDSEVIEHWNGSTWQRVKAPGDRYSAAYAVDGGASDDVWAVGSHQNSAWAWHWDGKRWAGVAVSQVDGAQSVELDDVSSLSPDDAWAVGYYRADSALHGLIEHWDGSSWQVVKGAGRANPEVLQSVSATASGDVWASGLRQPDQRPSSSVMEHFDGKTWSVSKLPATLRAGVYSVSASASDEALALGESSGGFGVARWDGTRWRATATPLAGKASAGEA